MNAHGYRQLPLGIRPRVGFTFDSYVCGDNALLVDMLQSMAHGKGEQQIYLWAGRGGGKSHLLQAGCNRAALSGRTSCYLTAEQLQAEAPAVLDGLEHIGLVCVDDVDALTGGGWDEALFNLVNRMRANDNRLVFSASRAPDTIDTVLPDLRSRLAWGPVFRIRELDDADKMRALQTRAGQYGLELGEAVAAYLLRHYPRNMFELFEHLERLDDASMAAQRRLTIPFVKSVLQP